LANQSTFQALAPDAVLDLACGKQEGMNFVSELLKAAPGPADGETHALNEKDDACPGVLVQGSARLFNIE